MHMSTGAESVSSVALLKQPDPLGSVLASSQACPAVDAADHPVLKAFNNFGWAFIGLLFAHAVLMSVNPGFCLLGCEPAAANAPVATPAPMSRSEQGAPAPGP